MTPVVIFVGVDVRRKYRREVRDEHDVRIPLVDLFHRNLGVLVVRLHAFGGVFGADGVTPVLAEEMLAARHQALRIVLEDEEDFLLFGVRQFGRAVGNGFCHLPRVGRGGIRFGVIRENFAQEREPFVVRL